MTLRLGTRGSALALAQSGLVARQLAAASGEPVELVEITTAGDRSRAPVHELGVGVFVTAIREALYAKHIDVAVHSYKDLPTGPADGLTIAAVPTREDPADALVSRRGGLAELRPGSRVGTGAPRRVAQLHALGRGLVCVPMRGNVDTRLSRVADGSVDAVILAAAGLRRLDRCGEITEIIDVEVMLPAPAQGALAVECRTQDSGLVGLVAALDDEQTRAAVTAERAFLAALEAGCQDPIAALATVIGAELRLRGACFGLDGRRCARATGIGAPTDATEIGVRLAAGILASGPQPSVASA